MLKKCFASFFIACLVFSVSVLPCFADEVKQDIAITGSISGRDNSVPSYNHVYLPTSDKTYIYRHDAATFTRQPMTVTSAYYQPAEHDRTVYLTMGVMTDVAGGDAWFNSVDQYANKPSLQYSDSRDGALNWDGLKTMANAVDVANPIYPTFGDSGEIFNFKITVPAYSNTFTFSTEGFVLFTCELSPWYIVSYGGYIIDTADSDILAVVEQILAKTNSIDSNITNIVSAINDIILKLEAIGADTATIIEMLDSLTDINDRQLAQLELISTNVEAIYTFLVNALASESEQVNEQAQDAITKIEATTNQEVLYQTSMQNSYDRIDLENFNFGNMDSSLQVVASIFSDMWSAWGTWNILFTFPLVLGLALLVIGRISKSGGGNSSRTSEHKGGEGGA